MRAQAVLCLALSATALLALSTPAKAEPKPWIWSWWESHFTDLDFVPYIEDPKQPQHHQWRGRDWTPEDWIVRRGGPRKLVKGFYSAQIITGQTEEGDVPVLKVGPGFYRLSGYDKRRVTQTLDYIYGTTQKGPGIYYLQDWKSKELIGVYTASHGLQLQ